MVKIKDVGPNTQDSLEIILEIARDKGTVTAQEVIDKTGFARSTVHKALNGMFKYGYLEYIDKSTYRITNLGARDFIKFRAKSGNQVFFAHLGNYENFQLDKTHVGQQLEELGNTIKGLLDTAEEFAMLPIDAPQSRQRALSMRHIAYVKDLEVTAEAVSKLAYVLNSMVNTPDAISLKGLVKYFDKQQLGDLPIPPVR